VKKIKITSYSNNDMQYKLLFEGFPDATLLIEEDSIIDCNKAAVELYGLTSKEELIGLKTYELHSKDDESKSYYKERDEKMLKIALELGNHRFEEICHIKNGRNLNVEIILNSLPIKNRKLISAIVRDITENKEKEKSIDSLIFKDYLTGLYNKRFFTEYLKKELIRIANKKENLAVLFMDLDGFKKINDNLGHENGDKVLQIVADELKEIIGELGIVARFGGDEFLITIPKIKSSKYVLNIAQKIVEIFKQAFIFDTHVFYISTSIGIAMYPSGGTDAETLIKNADMAMYKAKETSGSKIEFYSSDLNEKISNQFVLENNLWFALDKNELFLQYQPIIDIEKNEIIAAEVLLRWDNDKLGLIPPDKFIPIAEESNLIVPIGQWILKTACYQNKMWQDIGLKPITIAVNISVKQLEQEDFPELVEEILNETRLDPQYLELEITESISAKNIEDIIKILKKLSNLGVKLSIDDFGTGYSSLGQLKKLFIDKLKIDKSFVNDINEDLDNTAIVSTIIAMANILNLKVVAEGIETQNQLSFLKENSCHMGQGYLFSRPLDGDAFEELLKRKK
jgi:diguanylate cyclase (GGDEF)-like protein/PAS domain S-box-containing protein